MLDAPATDDCLSSTDQEELNHWITVRMKAEMTDHAVSAIDCTNTSIREFVASGVACELSDYSAFVNRVEVRDTHRVVATVIFHRAALPIDIGVTFSAEPSVDTALVYRALRSIAAQVANLRYEAATHFLAGDLQLTLADGSEAISSPTRVAQAVKAALAADDVIFWKLGSGERPILETIAYTGNGARRQFNMRYGQGIAGHCAATVLPLSFSDIQDPNQLASAGISRVKHQGLVERKGWRSAMFIPLIVQRRCRAVIACYSKLPFAFTPVEQQLAASVTLPFRVEALKAADDDRVNRLSREHSKAILRAEQLIEREQVMHDVGKTIAVVLNRLDRSSSLMGTPGGDAIARLEVAECRTTLSTAADRLREAISERSFDDEAVWEPNFEIVQLSDAFAQLRAEFGPSCDENQVKLTIPDPDPAFAVEVDVEAFQNILRNLIDNAIHFTGLVERPRLIDVSAERRGSTCVVRVRDSGSGIPTENLHQVFDAYFTTRGAEGRGLGLTSSRGLAELHQGTLEADSRWGSYAEFILTIPMRQNLAATELEHRS